MELHKREYAKWIALKDQRSQNIADEMYTDGPNRYKVWLEGIRRGAEDLFGRPDPTKGRVLPTGMPTLYINAHSEEEAWGRYEKLCGINALTGEPPPQKRIEFVGPAQPLADNVTKKPAVPLVPHLRIA
jgi:hypothetical protein